MKPKNHFTKLTSRLLMITLAMTTLSLFDTTTEAYAKNDALALPLLNKFIETVTNGEADTLRGIYVPKVMALSIVQQPEGNSKFISEKRSTATQFSMAARAGNVGLLAHNRLAGKLFFKIQPGDQIILVYGDGHTELFVVENILKYQSLVRGEYKDMETQNVLDAGELFNEAYSGEHHVTLQTCIENNDNLEWGRLFIIAQPVNHKKAVEEVPSSAPKAKTAEPLIVLGWPLAPVSLDVDEAKETGETTPH